MTSAAPDASGDSTNPPAASEAPDAPPVRPPTDPAWMKHAWLFAVALGVVFFCLPIGKSGIWDPFELTIADLSRRISINVLGARDLVLEGGDNSMPRLGDLGKGEL